MSTVVAAIRPLAGTRARRSYFYVGMSAACLAVCAIGFSLTYWIPLTRGTFKGNPVVHIHGWLLFTWMLLQLLQSWLVASGRTAHHRDVGLLGVSLATSMVIATLLAAVNRAEIFLAQGHTLAGSSTFVGTATLDMIAFATVLTIALVNVHRPETHRRLVLIATISLVGAAVTRIYAVFALQALLTAGTQFHVDLPVLTTDLLLAAPLIHDLRTRKSIHRANSVGVGALLTLHVFRVPLLASGAVRLLGGGVLALIGHTGR